ncbi:MAG: hypothetical protein ISS66_16890 [Desulfobacteraceae bacterium]|nr:hypothetical protein [Desulfobacteraceae bacterium]
MGNWFKTTLLLGAMTALIVLIGYLFGGQQGMVFAFILGRSPDFWSGFFT